MTEVCSNDNKKSTADFSVLSFERKLVELVEELRLRRNLEVEGEKTLKSVMDEKYTLELSWEEQQRRHIREKEDLEQQIELLKRKLEDKVCVSDDDKAKQHVMNKTYSHEIRILKEELRVAKSEKLNLQKKIQELEGKLNLHDSFQESIMTQISDVRKMIKSILEESQQLSTMQKTVMENVASAKSVFRKYDLCNQHLQQSMAIVGKKSEALMKELVSSRSENTILKLSIPVEQEKPNNDLEMEKLQKKVLNLENLLFTSRKENEKTLSNFLESNKLLCKFMDKYSETQEREKQLTKELELFQEKLDKTGKKLQETEDKMKKNDELAALKEKERIEKQCSIEIQTENNFKDYCSCANRIKLSGGTEKTAFPSLVSDKMHKDFEEEIRNGLVDLQQNAVIMQLETHIKSDTQNFSMDHLSGSSGDKKITVSEVLKRKLKVMESGDKIELISMKRRFTENNTHPVFDIKARENGDMKNEIQSLSEANNSQLCINLKPYILKSEELVDMRVDQKYLGAHEESAEKYKNDN